MQAWNKPTTEWRLECENSGDTVEEAIRRMETQLVYSNYEDDVANVGMVTIIFYSVMLGCGPCCFCALKEGAFFALIGCTRFCWLIMGVMLLVFLSAMEEAVEANRNVVNEYAVINKCGI